MLHHHAFGRAGRAGGIDHVAEIAWTGGGTGDVFIAQQGVRALRGYFFSMSVQPGVVRIVAAAESFKIHAMRSAG